TGDSQARVSLPCDPPEAGRVFQVAHVRAGDVRAVFATDVTEVAAAETMRREFIQTLTKIFANLTTGLAVFDRHRRLVLFNPALIDLVGLSAPFLSAQPSLFRFFDSLRDARVLPEPRNYGTWRKQIEDVIETASGGLYLEDWHQPCGTTFRVTGRPHPDGAIAFLFEDITDNVSLARHFRSQVALRDAILDSSDVARVVFGPDNVVTFCNRACRDMLGIDPDATFADMTLDDVLKACGNVLPRGDIWPAVARAVRDRDLFEASLPHPDGSHGDCRVRPLGGNAAIISLRPGKNTPRSVETVRD
ncbi:MAG: PAS-domain containing protein, partial [Roseovarius sp.]